MIGSLRIQSCALICQTMMSSKVCPKSAGRRRTDPSFTMSIARRPKAHCKTVHPRSRGDGGARRDRTDDLMLAKHALYQLSYGPIQEPHSGELVVCSDRCHGRLPEMVGPGRLELPTLRLSGVRSNHLSYGPMAARRPNADLVGPRPTGLAIAPPDLNGRR